MSLTRHPLNVSITLDRVLCMDEGDGPGNAEPYLWTLFYKIDGDTVRFGEQNFLEGTVTVERRHGEHGNLQNTNVDEGDTVTIPPSIGRWNTTLKPIPIVESRQEMIETLTRLKGTEWKDLPGLVGVVFILMEEDNLPNSSAVAGYNAFCSTFEARMNELIPTLGLVKLGLSEEDERGIAEAIREAVVSAMADNLNVLQAAWNWLAGPDQTLGSAAIRFTHDQLVETNQIFFDHQWKEGVSVFDPTTDPLKYFVIRGPGRVIESGGEWRIFGSVSATPVPQFVGDFGAIIVFSEEEMAIQSFRHRAEVASREGFVGAFPNFQRATYGRSEVGGTIFLQPGAAEYRDVPLFDLKNPPLTDFDARFQATQVYARQNGFLGGFPNFLQAERLVFSPFVGGESAPTVFAKALGRSQVNSGAADPTLFAKALAGSGVNPKLKGLVTSTDVGVAERLPTSGLVSATVCGTVLVRIEAGVWRDIPLAELGNPVLTDIGARFRATQTYATQNGFVGGFPTFFDADHGDGIVCGTILLIPESAVWRDVLLWLGPA